MGRSLNGACMEVGGVLGWKPWPKVQNPPAQLKLRIPQSLIKWSEILASILAATIPDHLVNVRVYTLEYKTISNPHYNVPIGVLY